MILGRTERTLAEAAKDSPRIGSIVADLGDSGDLPRVVRQVEADHGRLDILVNNAGPAPVTPFADMKMEEFDATFRVNTRAVPN